MSEETTNDSQRPASPPVDELMTVGQTAAYIGRSIKTVQKWTGTTTRDPARHPPFVKLGGRIYFFRREIDAWLMAHQRSGRLDAQFYEQLEQIHAERAVAGHRMSTREATPYPKKSKEQEDDAIAPAGSAQDDVTAAPDSAAHHRISMCSSATPSEDEARRMVEMMTLDAEASGKIRIDTLPPRFYDNVFWLAGPVDEASSMAQWQTKVGAALVKLGSSQRAAA